MKIYSLRQIGDYHTNYCEDYSFIGEIDQDTIICAVMDGCTQARDSYFAATLVGKILKKISIEYSYLTLYKNGEDRAIDLCLKEILCSLFKELRLVKNQMMLETHELMTTLVLLLIDKKSKAGVVFVIGDGFVCINGVPKEFDQENTPDYIGYHLHDDFDSWYAKQTQYLSFKELNDISIATDGITMFKKLTRGSTIEEIDPIHFLTIDKRWSDRDDMLQLKLKNLEQEFGLKPTDDLAVIRLINQNE